jgi:polyisoprenoid-binding protein YceI
MLRMVFSCLFLLFSSAAYANNYTALPTSTLGFQASYQGEKFDGSFSKFTPSIRFNPAQLAQSSFDVSINLASANTKNEERDTELQGSAFFNSAKFPNSRYQAAKFRSLGQNRFVAEGFLTLRGVRKPVNLTFTWKNAAGKTELIGSAVVKRLDFAVGAGDWADLELLPNEVSVKTHLFLKPAAAAASAKK